MIYMAYPSWLLYVEIPLSELQRNCDELQQAFNIMRQNYMTEYIRNT